MKAFINKALFSVLLATAVVSQASQPTEADVTSYAVKAKQYQTDYITPDSIAKALTNYFGPILWWKQSKDGEITYVVAQGQPSGWSYYREFKVATDTKVDTGYISVKTYP